MDKEQKLQLKKIVKNPAMSWIFGVSGKLKLGVLLLVLLNSAISISAVAFALVLREAIDGAVSGNKMVFLKFVIILGLIMLGQIAARGVIRFLDEYVRSGMENVIKTRLYETILSRKYSAITAFHTGELLNRITNDAVVVADGFVQIIPGIIAMLVKLAGAAAVLFVLDYRFSVIFFAGGGLVLIFTTLFRRVMKKLHTDVQAADGVLRSYLSENLGSLMVLKTFGAERKSTQ